MANRHSSPHVHALQDAVNCKACFADTVLADSQVHGVQVMALLANGADPNLKSMNGARAAEWAQQAGFQEVADILQEHAEAEQAASKVAAEAAALSSYQVRLFEAADPWSRQRNHITCSCCCVWELGMSRQPCSIASWMCATGFAGTAASVAKERIAMHGRPVGAPAAPITGMMS